MYIAWISCWSIIGGVVKLYYCNKLCGLSYKEFFTAVFSPCLIITILTSLIGIIVCQLMNEGLLRLLLVCIGTSMTFVFMGWKVALTAEEKLVIMKLLDKIKFKKRYEKNYL